MSLASQVALLAARVATECKSIRTALATTIKQATTPPLYYLNAYDAFFKGAGNVFVAGQATTATTVTTGVASGATVLPVASAAGLATGVMLVTGAGTATQQVHRVLSVAALNVTLTAPVSSALANGASVAPLWTNDSHLTFDSVGGSKAFGYFVANGKDAAGNFIITGSGKTVVWLGDSWAAQAVITFDAELDSRLGPTTVVNAGVAGNTLAAMLARFDTDVAPAAPDFVILQFGVNDIYGAISPTTLAGQLETIVAKVRALGAVPIVTGIVPLSLYPTTSAAAQVDLKARTVNGATYPAVPQSYADSRYAAPVVRNTSALGLGTDVLLATTTGDFNTAFGWRALRKVTTGSYNTALGQNSQPEVTTGSNNLAMGSGSQPTLTTGSNNIAIGTDTQLANVSAIGNIGIGIYTQLNLTAGPNIAIGSQASRGLTTGISNTVIGDNAGYSPDAVPANAATTANGQTLVGRWTGQGSATASSWITCLGYRATADGAGGVAIGADSGGVGAKAVAANEIALGTANHTTRLRGWLQLDKGQTTVGAAGAAAALPATPTKYLSVKDSTGTEYVLPVYAKA